MVDEDELQSTQFQPTSQPTPVSVQARVSMQARVDTPLSFGSGPGTPFSPISTPQTTSQEHKHHHHHHRKLEKQEPGATPGIVNSKKRHELLSPEQKIERKRKHAERKEQKRKLVQVTSPTGQIPTPSQLSASSALPTAVASPSPVQQTPAPGISRAQSPPVAIPTVYVLSQVF